MLPDDLLLVLESPDPHPPVNPQNENMALVIQKLQFSRQHIKWNLSRAAIKAKRMRKKAKEEERKRLGAQEDFFADADDDEEELTHTERVIISKILWEVRRDHQAAVSETNCVVPNNGTSC